MSINKSVVFIFLLTTFSINGFTQEKLQPGAKTQAEKLKYACWVNIQSDANNGNKSKFYVVDAEVSHLVRARPGESEAATSTRALDWCQDLAEKQKCGKCLPGVHKEKPNTKL